jgi:hypothetical protein
MPVIPAPRRRWQEDSKFQDILGYIVRPKQKKKKKKKKRNLVSVSGRYVFFSPHVQARQSTIELNPLSGFVFLERHI